MSPATPRAASRRVPAKPRLPKERTQFKELLLANHFGTVAGSKLKAGAVPSGNTTYEQLMCVGYNPQLKRLDAVVNIKETAGYSGDICTDGSQEYVKFFVSTDSGASWSELGTVSFTVWDVAGPKPLEYGATLYVNLAEACCKDENLVLVRAILSWGVPPGGPDDPVVWGNTLDQTIQVEPIGTAGATLAQLIECLEIEVPIEQVAELADLEQSVELAATKKLSPLELAEVYKGTKVEPKRFLFPTAQAALAKPELLTATLAAPTFELFPGLTNIDVKQIVASLSDPQGNETYEQIGCVGLNPRTDELVATIDLKLSSGYSGGLCSTGSLEYVAFWVDWQDGGGWHYVGTTAVNVHDISSIPKTGLGYSVSLSFAQLLSHCQPCVAGPQTALIRAVLSWEAPPSTTNPFAVPVWGGHDETLVLIPPGDPIEAGGPELDTIGSMDIAEIDSAGLANGPAVAVGFTASASPFGGQVWFTGHVVNRAATGFGGPGIYYRIWISTDAGASWSFMNTTFTAWQTVFPSPPVAVSQAPQNLGGTWGDGWYPYLENDAELISVAQNTLGYWPSAGDGEALIYMEAKDLVGALGVPTTPKLIQLDNTAPVVELGPPIGGSCGNFDVGVTIGGTYSASDNEHLNTPVGLSLVPPSGVEPTKPSSSTSTTAEDGTWQLVTAGMPPCGYVIELNATDWTIVNSGSIGWQAIPAYQGFCLKAE